MDWGNTSALVTGADGFIASHLVDELVRQGCRVTAVVRRTSRSQVTHRFRNLSEPTVDLLAGLVQVDLAGPSAVDTLAANDARIWFHLAADAYVPASFDQPAAVVQSNIVSTQNVLDAARTAGVEHVLVTSSSEVYGSHDDAIGEDHPLRPATPYAASKVACDRLAWSYHNAFRTPLTIVRPFNCYGPRHVYDVVPRFLAKAVRGDTLTVNGSGHQTRDLTYVTDTVDALLRLADLEPRGEVFNIGTGEDHRILDIARTILELTGSTSELRTGPARKGEVHKLQADARKLRERTGWAPRFDLASGLETNLKWIQDNLAWL